MNVVTPLRVLIMPHVIIPSGHLNVFVTLATKVMALRTVQTLMNAWHHPAITGLHVQTQMALTIASVIQVGLICMETSSLLYCCTCILEFPSDYQLIVLYVGFEGNDTVCIDIDECLLDPCNFNGNCTNLNGSYSCACFQGQ